MFLSIRRPTLVYTLYSKTPIYCAPIYCKPRFTAVVSIPQKPAVNRGFTVHHFSQKRGTQRVYCILYKRPTRTIVDGLLTSYNFGNFILCSLTLRIMFQECFPKATSLIIIPLTNNQFQKHLLSNLSLISQK